MSQMGPRCLKWACRVSGGPVVSQVACRVSDGHVVFEMGL